MSTTITKERIGIVTGGDNSYILYLDALLRSVRLFNDLNLDIFIIDFGLTADDRQFLESEHGELTFLTWETVEPLLKTMRAIPGATERGSFPYVYATMRKLALYTHYMKEYMLWIDADCIVLEPISKIIGAKLPDTIRGSRNPRKSIDFQFLEKHDIVRDALALRLKQEFNLVDPYVQCSLNSGVIVYNSEKLRSFYTTYAERLLSKFGPYLYGDQAFLNICCSLTGSIVDDFDHRVNMSGAQTQKQVFFHADYKGRPYPAIEINDVRPFVFHFLHYKPAPTTLLKEAVKIGAAAHKLFDAWRHYK